MTTAKSAQGLKLRICEAVDRGRYGVALFCSNLSPFFKLHPEKMDSLKNHRRKTHRQMSPVYPGHIYLYQHEVDPPPPRPLSQLLRHIGGAQDQSHERKRARIKRFEALILEYGVEISSPPATTEGDDQANSRALSGKFGETRNRPPNAKSKVRVESCARLLDVTPVHNLIPFQGLESAQSYNSPKTNSQLQTGNKTSKQIETRRNTNQ